MFSTKREMITSLVISQGNTTLKKSKRRTGVSTAFLTSAVLENWLVPINLHRGFFHPHKPTAAMEQEWSRLRSDAVRFDMELLCQKYDLASRDRLEGWGTTIKKHNYQKNTETTVTQMAFLSHRMHSDCNSNSSTTLKVHEQQQCSKFITLAI